MPGGIHPPASVVALWPEPNYSNPETRPSVMPPLAIILNILLIIVSAIRLWTRYQIPRSSGWDDVFYALTVPVIFALTIVVPIATDANGYNRHIWDNPLETNVTRRKYALAIMTLFSLASCTLRISRLVSPIVKWTLWITIGFVGASGIVYSLKPVFACRPISAFWDQVDIRKIKAGYTYSCFDEGIDIIVAAVISAVQDLVTALLPNLVLWRLQVKLKQKIMLIALFSLAYCTAAVGFIRVYFNYRVYFGSYDVTWNAWTSWLLTMVELQLAALCACAPAVKAFLAHYGIVERLWQISKLSQDKHSGQQQLHRAGTIQGSGMRDTQLSDISTFDSKKTSQNTLRPTTKEVRTDDLCLTPFDDESKSYRTSHIPRSQGSLRGTDNSVLVAVNREFV